MTGDGNRSGFRRVMKLTVAAFGSNQAPPLFLQPLNDIADLHAAGIVAFAQCLSRLCFHPARPVFPWRGVILQPP